MVTFIVVILPVLFSLVILPLSHINAGTFLKDLGISALRLIIAYAISLFVALAAALLLIEGRLGAFFLPLFDVLQSFPSFALLPLIILWFGKSDLTVITFLVVTIIWPLLFAIISSMKTVREDWEEAATVFGARGWKRLAYFSLPISYPGIVTGSIVSLGDGWDSVIGAEIIVGLQAAGLGNFFTQAGSTQLILFGVLAMLLFIFAINKILWLPLLEKSHRLLTE